MLVLDRDLFFLRYSSQIFHYCHSKEVRTWWCISWNQCVLSVWKVLPLHLNHDGRWTRKVYYNIIYSKSLSLRQTSKAAWHLFDNLYTLPLQISHLQYETMHQPIDNFHSLMGVEFFWKLWSFPTDDSILRLSLKRSFLMIDKSSIIDRWSLCRTVGCIRLRKDFPSTAQH